MQVDPAEVLSLFGLDRTTAPGEAVAQWAEREAIALGDSFVGPCHVALALLGRHPDDVAANVLEACGVDASSYRTRHVELLGGMDPPAPQLAPGQQPGLSPACRELLGRAEGLAATRGAYSVGSEHALVGWLWQSHGVSVRELERFDVTGPTVLDALATVGVAAPKAPLPEPDRRTWGERVFFPLDRLDDVLRHVKGALGVGDWVWNRSGGRAWVISVADVDLRSVVEQALRSQHDYRA